MPDNTNPTLPDRIKKSGSVVLSRNPNKYPGTVHWRDAEYLVKLDDTYEIVMGPTKKRIIKQRFS